MNDIGEKLATAQLSPLNEEWRRLSKVKEINSYDDRA